VAHAGGRLLFQGLDAHPANASRIAGDSPFTESWLDAPKDTEEPPG